MQRSKGSSSRHHSDGTPDSRPEVSDFGILSESSGAYRSAASTRDRKSAPTLSLVDTWQMYSYDWLLAQLRGYWGRGLKDNCDFCDRRKIRTEIVAEVSALEEYRDIYC